MVETEYPRQEIVLSYLREHNIPFDCYNHPEGKTIEEAKRWWRDDGSMHCKNIFMRNHKGRSSLLALTKLATQRTSTILFALTATMTLTFMTSKQDSKHRFSPKACHYVES